MRASDNFFKELSCINQFHIFSYILWYNVFFYNTFQCNFVLIFNGLSRRQYEIKFNNFFCMCLKISSFTLESLIKKKCYPMITLIARLVNYTLYTIKLISDYLEFPPSKNKINHIYCSFYKIVEKISL